jgi:septal ring factor EnvC (AmiA/AmiB activator)
MSSPSIHLRASTPGRICIAALILLLGTSAPFAARGKQKAKSSRPAAVRASVKPAGNIGYDAALQKKNAQLDSIKVRLEEGRRKVSELRQQEGSQVSQLTQVEANITTSQDYLTALEKQMQSTGKRISLLADSLQTAAQRLHKRQDIMGRRLRAMYKSGVFGMAQPNSFLQVIISSQSIPEVLHRARYFNDLNQYDRILVRQIDSAKADIADHKISMETQLAKLIALQGEKKREQTQLLAERSNRQSLLEKIRSEKSDYLAMIKDLEESQRKLAAIIDELIKKKLSTKKRTIPAQETATQAAIKKARLPWPVKGTILSPFGKVIHPIYQTVTMNKGIDIGAAEGTPVACVLKGKIIYVDVMRGLGRFVIIEHEGGLLTIYAHMGTVYVTRDQQVAQGMSIGTVGKVGISEVTKLHFEIRKQSEPLDPMEWLE